MHQLWPSLAYIALLAYLPVAYAAQKGAAGGRWRNLTFARAVSKDFLRTFPMVALMWIPIFLFPAAARWYTLGVHAVFAPLAIFELVHIKYFGARVGVNTFYSIFVTNAREVGDYIRQSVTVLNIVSLVAIYVLPGVAIGVFMPNGAIEPAWLRWTLAAAAFFAFLPFPRNLTKKGSRFKIGYVLNPYSNLVYHWFVFKRSYGELKRNIAAHSAPPFAKIASSVSPEEKETYVICIGESASALHHSYCGYARNTNEFTDAFGDSIRRLPGVRSQFAQTLPSLEKVLTFADCANPDRLWTQGSMIDYFKEAGFKTFWLSNQYALDDTAITAMAGHADEMKCFNFGDMKRFERTGLDGDMLPEIEKALASPERKKAIFIHMIGSHAAYVNRYPAEFRHFDGAAPGKEHLSAIKNQMINTYDDSIRYTDYVVSRFIKALDSVGGMSFLLYFSDHGEDIYDTREDKPLGHSQLANLPMTAVPFMFWTSERYRELRPDVAKRQAKESYRLEDAIHTVIDLASLSNPDFVKSKSILS
ncbi:MAG: phosphoethanolamine transferase [Lentisphaerae bacterium]|nr:phosphoethanolamine transferase [Lentisphaerota bacterium]